MRYEKLHWQDDLLFKDEQGIIRHPEIRQVTKGKDMIENE
jgi:hypothetical protein